MTAMPTFSFAELSARPEEDPYEGDYKAVLATFGVPAVGPWDKSACFDRTLGVGDMTTNAYVGIFSTPGSLEGRTRLIHSPRRFPSIMGRSTPYDGQAFAILDDVTGTAAQLVHYEEDNFEATSPVTIPPTGNAAAILWASDPGLKVLPPSDVATAGRVVRVPYMMFVPARYITMFIGRRLSPRQLITEVLATIQADGNEASMGPFVDWLVSAGVEENTGDDVSPIVINDVTPPIADSNFLRWSQAFVYARLPELTGANTTSASGTTKIANIMTQVLQEQKAARQDAVVARTAAKSPKSINEYFRPHLTNKLLILCRVADEANLPELWEVIAAANGKQDRSAIEWVLRQIANSLSLPELAPVVTPGLAKKLTGLRFAGSNLDDLDEGISPFSIVIVDHTTAAGQNTYNEALSFADDYDDLTKGSSSATLNDLKVVKSTKAIIPQTFILARATLQSFRILLLAILGETHPILLTYNTFLNSFVNREIFFVGRIMREDAKGGPARLVRFVQLHIRAWFQATWDAADAITARGVPDPEWLTGLHKISIGDLSWLPAMPPQYCSEHAERRMPTDTSKEKATVVNNVHKNPRFEDFRIAITNTKFNDAIRRVGDPPKIKRAGKELNMCASYHLRGMCYSNCTRKADHGAHSDTEENALYEWCKLAFE
jgi:hypothetical protein